MRSRTLNKNHKKWMNKCTKVFRRISAGLHTRIFSGGGGGGLNLEEGGIPVHPPPLKCVISSSHVSVGVCVDKLAIFKAVSCIIGQRAGCSADCTGAGDQMSRCYCTGVPHGVYHPGLCQHNI